MDLPRWRASLALDFHLTRDLALVAALLALVWGAPPRIARAGSPDGAGVVTAVAGRVTVARASGTLRPLKFRDSLFWRDVVEANKDGMARVLIGGRTTVTVPELSRLELRQETLAEGVRYTVELVAGRVRASVARMLMRPGDQVEVRTRNAVASVRGTDFIVERLDDSAHAQPFGLLGVREVAHAVDASGSGDTVVVTLSGVVDVSNRASPGRVERIGAYEAVRVSGQHDPVRLPIQPNALNALLSQLTPPRPAATQSGDKAEIVGRKVEQAGLAAATGNARTADGGAQASGPANVQPLQTGSQSRSHDEATSGSAATATSPQPSGDGGGASVSAAPAAQATPTPGATASGGGAPAAANPIGSGSGIGADRNREEVAASAKMSLRQGGRERRK